MAFKFLPKDFNFFDLFEKEAAYAVEAADFFKELMSKGSINENSLNKMHQVEHDGDEVTHEIFERLNKTFITPFHPTQSTSIVLPSTICATLAAPRPTADARVISVHFSLVVH